MTHTDPAPGLLIGDGDYYHVGGADLDRAREGMALQRNRMDKIRRKRWVKTRHLVWNTHLNKTVTSDVWGWIRENFGPLHIIYFQEVLRPHELQSMLGEQWHVAPMNDIGRCSTFVAYRKRRYAKPTYWVKTLAGRKKFDRRIIGFSAFDKRTKRYISAGSLHTDPLGAGFENASRGARGLHVKQGRKWMQWAKARRKQYPEGEVFIGGDGNESIGNPVMAGPLRKKTLVAMMARARMQPASHAKNQRDAVYLDDLFVSHNNYSRIVRRWQGRPPKHLRGASHFDHDIVMTVTETEVLA